MLRQRSHTNNLGELVIVCQSSRSQAQNRKEAVQVMLDMFEDAGVPDKVRDMRDPNEPTARAKEEKKGDKIHHKMKQEGRGNKKFDDF